jgi:uncharacterized membrane protein YtjA (UPF0391 family)
VNGRAFRQPGEQVGDLAGMRVAMPLPGGTVMLYWALCFLVLAIIAGIFGFSGVAAASAGIAKILFVIFLALLVISAIGGFRHRRLV